jgi:hypothetical protein
MIDYNDAGRNFGNSLSCFSKCGKRLFGFGVNLYWLLGWILIHLRYANSPSGELVSPT